MRDLYVIAPLSSLSKRTRLFKLVNKLFKNNMFSHVHHIGWERVLGESNETDLAEYNISKSIILKGGGYGTKVARLKYICWVAKVFFYTLRIPRKSTVWALGFESAFPFAVASLFKGHKVYFDDADRFLLLFKWPSFIYKLIKLLEIFTSRKCFLHVVPNTARYDYYSDKFFELKNLPSTISIQNLALSVPDLPDLSSYKIVINVNGWLGNNRGMEVILNVLKHFSRKELAVLLSGRLDCVEAVELSNSDHCFYLGELTNQEALATYLISDFVFTYYDPSYPINKYAESNKWGDAIYMNTGILVNNEVLTADFLFKAGVVDSLSYTDHSTIINFIQECLNDPSIIKKQKLAVSALKSSFKDFDTTIELIFGFQHA